MNLWLAMVWILESCTEICPSSLFSNQKFLLTSFNCGADKPLRDYYGSPSDKMMMDQYSFNIGLSGA